MDDSEAMARTVHQATPTIRLFLVDDEPIVLKGLHLFLTLQPSLTVCGGAASGPEALKQIKALQPNLTVVDLGRRTTDEFEFIRQLRQRCPKSKILVFSMYDEVFFAQSAFRAGAHGYVTKEEGTESALEAIPLLMEGRAYVGPRVASKLPGAKSNTRAGGITWRRRGRASGKEPQADNWPWPAVACAPTPARPAPPPTRSHLGKSAPGKF